MIRTWYDSVIVDTTARLRLGHQDRRQAWGVVSVSTQARTVVWTLESEFG
jgi:hypothetical protein